MLFCYNEGMTEAVAIIYCEKMFNTTWGKTAHGLVRFTRRYEIVGVVDSSCAGFDAGELLDGKAKGIPIFSDIDSALANCPKKVTHLIFGGATDGGFLPKEMYKDILHALKIGLNVDCGLHYFLSDDKQMVKAAKKSGSKIRDIRKIPAAYKLHSYSGKIKEVNSFRVAILGTDSSVGKRTTAWRLIEAFESKNIKSELIGTGQTAWLQGARYGVRMDALINDFVAGEIENAVVEAWENEKPDVMIIEGQGSLLNPIYPGGFEIIAASSPHVIVLQHAPNRVDYDGLLDSPIHPLKTQIEAIELISGKKVVAITINSEGLKSEEVEKVCKEIERETGLITREGLRDSLEPIVQLLLKIKQTEFER